MSPLDAGRLLLAIAVLGCSVAANVVLLARYPRAALACAAVGLAIPWIAPPFPTARTWLALASFGVLARVVDLVRDRRRRDLALRIWHLVGIADTRRVRPVPPRVDVAAFGRCLAFAALFGLGLAIAEAARSIPGGAGLAIRWSGGLLAVYGFADAGFAAVKGYYGLLGADLPVLHRNPILSRTVAEFWGSRWNRVIGRWLSETFFAPLARRGRPALGVLAAFLASAALHVHFALAAAGPLAAASMGAFFLVQAAILGLERLLAVDRWPAALARAWTVATMVGTSPLFVEPFLRCVPVLR